MLILIVFLELQSCKKEDYRKDYTGNFNFTTVISVFNTVDSTLSDTTIYYSGEISYGANSDEIVIEYLQNSTLTASLRQDGTFTKPQGSGLGWGFNGEFSSKDKLTFSAGWFDGSKRTDHDVSGTRI